MSISRITAMAAGREAEQRLREWLTQPARCNCPESLPVRSYLNRWQCAYCGRPIDGSDGNQKGEPMQA